MKEIQLSQGKVALVDGEDYDRLMAMGEWYFHKGYAVRGINYKKPCGSWSVKTIMMHRVVMNAKTGEFVDHRFGDTLDNRKANLRICIETTPLDLKGLLLTRENVNFMPRLN